jgi:hypothetical protein
MKFQDVTISTDMAELICHGLVDFSHEKLSSFSEHDLRPYVFSERHNPNGTVDLSRVVGTEHPDYQGSAWLELLGNPPGGPSVKLKRIRSGLRYLQESPDYYLRPDKKEDWSFYLVNGYYHVTSGMHRTVISRFFLAGNNLPQTISGVSITEIILRQQPCIENGFPVF